MVNDQKTRKTNPIYPCKICNEDMFGREKDCSRRRYCRLCLKKRAADNHETFNCVICKTKVTRRKDRSRKHNAKCCSLLCQQKWRAKVSHNKTKDQRHVRRLEREQTKRQRQDEVYATKCLSCYFAVLTKLESKVRVRDKRHKDTWLTKLCIRLSQVRPNGLRRVKIKVAERAFDISWDNAIQDALFQIEQKKRWYEKDAWMKKIGNKLSNAKKRMRVKHERKSKNSQTNQIQVRGERIQMCFDWMGDNT